MNKTYTYTPKTSNFNKKGIQWFDDSQLIKREGGQGMQIINIQEFSEELEELKWFDGVAKFKITENFKLSEKTQYEVEGLQAEVDNNPIMSLVMFRDVEDIIVDSKSVLMGFLKTSLLQINKLSNQCYKLLFPDGEVVIEGISVN